VTFWVLEGLRHRSCPGGWRGCRLLNRLGLPSTNRALEPCPCALTVERTISLSTLAATPYRGHAAP
jgi:hypothetical protein